MSRRENPLTKVNLQLFEKYGLQCQSQDSHVNNNIITAVLIKTFICVKGWRKQRRRYSDWKLRSSETRMGVRFSGNIQTGPEAYPASCKICIDSFFREQSGRSMAPFIYHSCSAEIDNR